jgi:L,D-transpeptidase ErfK/SrfK
MGSLTPAVFLMLQLWGGLFNHVVHPGDSLTSIGARFGVDLRVLAEANGLKTTDKLNPGNILIIESLHIAPAAKNVDIVVNVPQRMLFFFEAERLVRAYPITAGRSSWRTPLGEFGILTLEVDPTWDVPPSIQEEMRRAGKPVLTHVPPSPQNPLGKYWIGLSLPGVGIHGTNLPISIYTLTSHGCIRLHPDDIADLFGKVDFETRGRVIYEPVLLGDRDGTVFLEVHPDAYKRVPDTMTAVRELGRSMQYLDKLDWTRVKEVVSKREGVARDVTRR